jgi:hypothetical protein
MSELFGLERMAARLGVTRAWLLEQANAGKVPCLKAGKRFLFSPTAVVEALAIQAGRTSSRAESGPLESVGAHHEGG